MTADETNAYRHDYNVDLEKQLQKKLLTADETFALTDLADTVQTLSTNGNIKLRKVFDCASENLTGWFPNPKIILRRADRESKSANSKDVQQFSNYYKLKQAQDTYVFKHYKDIRKYIQQYRHEHTCLGPTQTASVKEVGDQMRRNTFAQNTVPPPQQVHLQNGHSAPSQNMNVMNGQGAALQYTYRRDNTVCTMNYNGSNRGASYSPDTSVQGYRYKLTPGAPNRTDTEVSSESEKDIQTFIPPRACSAKLVRQNRGLMPTKVTVPSSPNIAGTRAKQGPLQSLTVQPQPMSKAGDGAYLQNGTTHLENHSNTADKQEADLTGQEDDPNYTCLLKSTASCLTYSQTPHLKYQNASDISVSPTSVKAESMSQNKQDQCFSPNTGRDSSTSCTYHVFPDDYMFDGINSMVSGKLHWNPSLSSLVVRGKHDILSTEHDDNADLDEIAAKNSRPIVKLATTRVNTDFPQERDEYFVSNDERDNDNEDKERNFTNDRRVRPTTDRPIRMTSAQQRQLNKLPNNTSKQVHVPCLVDVNGDKLPCRRLRPELEGNGDSLQHLTRPVPIFSFLVSMGKAGRKLTSAKHPPPEKEKKRPQSEVDLRMRKLASFVLSGYHAEMDPQPKTEKAHLVEKQKKKGPSVASGVTHSLLEPDQDRLVEQSINRISKCRNCDTTQDIIKHRLSFRKCRLEQQAIEGMKPNRNLKKVQKRSHHKLNFLKDLPEREYSEVGNEAKATLMELTEKFSDKEQKRKGVPRETTLTELYEQRRLKHIIEQLKLKMTAKQKQHKAKESNALPSTLAWLEPYVVEKDRKSDKKFKLTITSKQVGFHDLVAATQRCNTFSYQF